MKSVVNFITEQNLGKLLFDYPASKLTSLGIGGIVKYLYYPKDLDSLILVIKTLKNKNLKYFVIGNGTNLLFKDCTYEYLFIKLNYLSRMEKIEKNYFFAEAGAQGVKFSKFVINNNSSGSEFMSIIPGTIGGLIYMNASSYHKSISDYLEKVEYLNEFGEVCVLENKNDFNYRKSFFTNTNLIITKGYFRFLDENPNSNKIVKEFRLKKQSTQPLEYKSAGSTFRNYDEIPAWKLIDKSGFRNFRIGNVCISKKHANFLINLSKASFNEANSLIEKVKNKVYEDSGYLLECELEIVEP